jgi:hypothetical protein
MMLGWPSMKAADYRLESNPDRSDDAFICISVSFASLAHLCSRVVSHSALSWCTAPPAIGSTHDNAVRGCKS